MKTTIQTTISGLAIALALIFHPSSARAQGSLTPPGSPAPTMKSLDQIEPRTPIATAPFTISQPGSYYLTANLTVSSGDAIIVATNGVTLDLNGFTISSVATNAEGTAILLRAERNVAIRNGFLVGGVTNDAALVFSGSGFANGIHYESVIPRNVRVSNVSVSGCLGYGIHLGVSGSLNATVVESCTVDQVGGEGILADSVVNSTATSCGSHAITANQAANCHGSSFTGNGIAAKSLHNSYGVTTSGFAGVNATLAQNCWGQSQSSSSGYGLLAAVAQNCEGSSGSSSPGVSASVANTCFGISTGSGTGLAASRAALNCWGQSTSGVGLSAALAQGCYGGSTTGGNVGLDVEMSAQNCFGSGYQGIVVSHSTFGHGIANNCYGVATGPGNGISADITIGSYGRSTNSWGIGATIANSSEGNGIVPVGALYKYDMP